MAKLYPPKLDSTLPSFYNSLTPSDKPIIKLTVPFSMNRTVGKNEVGGFAIKIKNVQNLRLIASLTTTNQTDFTLGYNTHVTFDVSNFDFLLGQSYKVQIAYIDNYGVIGYYSDTAVIKFTQVPEVFIEGLDKVALNGTRNDYTLVYSQKNGDVTEKLFSLKYFIFDPDKNIIEESESILHNTNNDIDFFEAREEFKIKTCLSIENTYYLQVECTTSSGLVVRTPSYPLIDIVSIDPESKITLESKMNFEEGLIDVYIVNHNENNLIGKFVLSRASSEDNFNWQKLGDFLIQKDTTKILIWRDYTIKHGVSYKYCLQQVNDYNFYSNRLETAIIKADFEDMFLFDGERQLKVRFNPKVSSFKRNIQEQKIDTIGSQYPFIFRNGTVNYHEFPISGLISYISDNEELFTSKDKLGIENESTDFTGDNIYAERIFKTEVLDWLTNGKEKVFKSPTEGNFIVRLTNVSLTPVDTVGRMLHTFNCTAFETNKYSYENLEKLDFLPRFSNDLYSSKWAGLELTGISGVLNTFIDTLSDFAVAKINAPASEEIYTRIKNENIIANLQDYFTSDFKFIFNTSLTKEPDKKEATGDIVQKIKSLRGKVTSASGRLNRYPMYALRLQNFTPGTIFYLDGEEFMIGQSGAYIMDFNIPVNVLTIKDPVGRYGNISYEYRSEFLTGFNLMHKIEVIDVPCRQFIGKQFREYYDYDTERYVTTNNILEIINTSKQSLRSLYSIKLMKRDMQIIFKGADKKYYWDMDCTKLIDTSKLSERNMYAICIPRPKSSYDMLHFSQYYVDANLDCGFYMREDGTRIEAFTHKYLIINPVGDNGRISAREINESPDLCSYTFGGEVMSLAETEKYIFEDDGAAEATYLSINDGIVCEISYKAQINTYRFEDSNEFKSYALKTIYDRRIEVLSDMRKKAANTPFIDAEGNLDTTLIREMQNVENSSREAISISYRNLVKQLDSDIYYFGGEENLNG